MLSIKASDGSSLFACLACIKRLSKLLFVEVVPPGILILTLPKLGHHKWGLLPKGQESVPPLIVHYSEEGLSLRQLAAGDNLAGDLGKNCDIAGVEVHYMELGDGKAAGEDVFRDGVAIFTDIGSRLQALFFDHILPWAAVASIVESILVHPAEASHDAVLLAPLSTISHVQSDLVKGDIVIPAKVLLLTLLSTPIRGVPEVMRAVRGINTDCVLL
jgi:hypothetical protein